MSFLETALSRRKLLAGSAAALGCSCLAGCHLPATGSDRKRLLSATAGEVVDRRSYGRIEKLDDRTYAFVSTPFDAEGGAGDRTTHSNGGLVAGDDGVLLIDSFRRPEGAVWAAEFAYKTFGMRPTHVVCTHFHFDHVGGLAGLIHAGVVPEIIMSQTTADRCRAANGAWIGEDEQSKWSRPAIHQWGGFLIGPTRVLADESEPVTLDLGGREVRLIPLRGHTDSDLAVEVSDPAVVYGGDLIWNGIFPNFMSATPSQHLQSVHQILEHPRRIVVPGHGPAASSDSAGIRQFAQLLEHIQDHARMAHAAGRRAEDAASSFEVPASLGQWKYFRDGFHQSAMNAWYRELSA